MPKAACLDKELLAQINAAKPDIIWVGLGSPKQDLWNVLNRDALDAPVLVGIGAAFDFLSGMKLQAPRWMQHMGLEWFFRLCCEPRRLWRRYLIGNTQFLWLLLVAGLRRKS
jgi:N-acetylglucosaminyldiphosphoundecaprenol N-acetyl-beta-D-mannosaminyltransferase